MPWVAWFLQLCLSYVCWGGSPSHWHETPAAPLLRIAVSSGRRNEEIGGIAAVSFDCLDVC